jgi:hypothetical protein
VLEKVRVLDLREAPTRLKMGPRAFAGFRFNEVSVPFFGPRALEYCAGFMEAFDLFGSPWGVTFAAGDNWKKALGPVRKSEVRALRGAVPLVGFDWRDFPQLVDLSGMNWTELPKVPDAVKGTLALTSLSGGLREIPDFAFDGCRSLALTALPEAVVSIGRFAFRGCTALRLKTLPKGLKRVEVGAFEGCASLALSTWPEGIENDGRCGVVLVDGAVRLLRRVKLVPLSLLVGEKGRKTYVFDVSGEVEASGAVAIEGSSGMSVTVVAEPHGLPGEYPFMISVRTSSVMIRGTGLVRVRPVRAPRAVRGDESRRGEGVRLWSQQRDGEG